MNPLAWLDGLVTKNLEKIAEQARAFVFVVVVVAGLAIAVALAVDDQAVRIVVLGAAFVVVAIMGCLLYLTIRASAGGGADADHAAIGRALSLVNGYWWQLVVNDRTPGLTVVSIDLSVLPDRHRLSGTKYDPSGREMATWKSRAVGLMEIDPVEVFYYWQGSYAGGIETVSGVGFFDFPRGSAKFETGNGWFTTGDVEEGDFSETSKIHLRRIDEADQAVLGSGGAEAQDLIRTRYEGWAAKYAAT